MIRHMHRSWYFEELAWPLNCQNCEHSELLPHQPIATGKAFFVAGVHSRNPKPESGEIQMTELATPTCNPQPEFMTYVSQAEKSLPKSPFILMEPCAVDAFYLEAGINMLELPGTVGVMILRLKHCCSY